MITTATESEELRYKSEIKAHLDALVRLGEVEFSEETDEYCFL
jgi:hypothetical protein